MPLDPDKLELKFDGCAFGVSARRIHEHMTLAQINPFARSLASVQSPQDAAVWAAMMTLYSGADPGACKPGKGEPARV